MMEMTFSSQEISFSIKIIVFKALIGEMLT